MVHTWGKVSLLFQKLHVDIPHLNDCLLAFDLTGGTPSWQFATFLPLIRRWLNQPWWKAPTIFLSVFLLLHTHLVQGSELRHSRQSLPGLSATSTLGINLHLTSPAQGIDSQAILDVLTHRMTELGYTIAPPSDHDSQNLILQMICEGSFTDITPSIMSENVLFPEGKSAQTPTPPCYVAYQYLGEPIHWKKIDRIIFGEGIAAAKQLPNTQTLDPTNHIVLFLQYYDFPVLLAAEWGQINRLIQVLHDPRSSLLRQHRVILLLGEIRDSQGFSPLVEALQKETLAAEAAQAMGFFGLHARPYLLQLLRTAECPIIQAAAAKGLGRIAALTGDSSPTPLFLDIIQNPEVDIRVKTELVWALGKSPDFRAFPVLTELEQTIWTVHSEDPELEKLRLAVDWSIREVKQGGHGDDY